MVIYTKELFLFGSEILEQFVSSINEILARLIVLFTAITVHEYAHGFVAYKLGDPTAKYAGRLSFNPISHIDPIGALCMVLCGFGWAKPVPINPMYFKDRKRDSALVALAGPLSNIILAFISAVLAALFFAFVYLKFEGNVVTDFVLTLFIQLAQLNIGFAVFNLIPFPPLDGSKIVGAFLSNSSYYKFMQYEHFGFPILILMSITGLLGKVLYIFIEPLWHLWFSFFERLVELFV